MVFGGCESCRWRVGVLDCHALRLEYEFEEACVRTSTIWLVVSAVVVMFLVALGGQALIEPNRPLIVDVSFSPEVISPNADGDDDIAAYAYELSDNAVVSLIFEAADGTMFAFRDNENRSKGEYEGFFSGVVDGFVLDGETIEGDIVRRLIPDGEYTWTLTATTADGETDSRSGTFTIENGDAALPLISTFSVSPEVFTPNQDGIRDRTQINVYLEKDADLDVYLLTPDNVQLFIPPIVEETREGEAGRYRFDYDGGVDGGSEPPADGEYTVVAAAQDAVGQRIERRQTLALYDGGKPLAEIVSQTVGADVVFEVMPYDERYASAMGALGEPVARPDSPDSPAPRDVTMPLGDVLVFKLTVENYSDVPIRTHGAPPGTVFEQNQRAASLGDYDESGAWRVGIDCDTAVSDYPWRWAIGDESVLETVTDDENGNVYYYLPAGERAVVWGGIRMTELIDARNPQNCWAGLIHEDVAVSIRNSRVGARSIELVDPNATLYTDSDDE